MCDPRRGAGSAGLRIWAPIKPQMLLNYLTAFENSTLDPALLHERLAALRAKTAQLQARRDELTELLDQAPAMPTDDDLDTLAEHVDQILDRGTRLSAKP
jgi:hypothetical protein